MGGFFGKLRPKKEVRVVILGLDGAGKTTTLYHLKLGRRPATYPTIGFHVETLETRSLKMVIWDVGGQEKIRSLWWHYFCKTAAIIFVVDCTDKVRINEVRYELHHLLLHEELRNTVVIIFANKQDLPNAWDVTEITRQLQMHSVQQQWHVCATSAKTGEGLKDAIEYLREMLERKI